MVAASTSSGEAAALVMVKAGVPGFWASCAESPASTPCMSGIPWPKPRFPMLLFVRLISMFFSSVFGFCFVYTAGFRRLHVNPQEFP